MIIDLQPAGAKALRADLRVSEDGRFVSGTVLAAWRGEYVVWTVGAYAGQALECSNGEYFPVDGAATAAYDRRRATPPVDVAMSRGARQRAHNAAIAGE